MSVKKHIFAACVFGVLSAILIVSWFRYGFLYGGGDVGIPSYDPPRIVEIAKYVWWEAGAPGNLVPHGVTSLPFQFFQSALSGMGLSYFVVQATGFWMLLFLTGFGMFLLGLSVFGKDKFLFAVLSGLFYMLNPFMMIQVWHRFIHNSFFLAAFLPFFYLFWNDWIKKGRVISILLFLVANIFGVYLYGTIAYFVTVFFLLAFIFLKNTIFPWYGFNYFKKTALRFLIGLVFWILIHTWWILPTFTIAPALFSSQHRTFDSVETLITLARQMGIPYILPGINPYYLFEQADFGQIYKHPLFLTIMWLPLFLSIPGFLVSIKSKALSSWGILLVAAGLVAKGAAGPFGYFYIFAFTQFFALGVLRNPYEKMGIFLPFSMAIILTAGFKWYIDRFGKISFKFTSLFLGALLFLQLGVFLWPFWTGRLIGKSDKLALVEVPSYYREADSFIKEERKKGKILHLPLPTGESISYSWPYPFSGIESSQLLFSSEPSISRGLNIDYIDDAINAASNIFREDVPDEKIIQILKSLNVNFIVLHQDVHWEGGFLDNPVKLEKILNQKKFLDKKKQFGQLLIYEIKEEYFRSHIYTASGVNFLSRGVKNSFWPYLLSQNNADFISTTDNYITNPLQTLIMPSKIWTFHPEDLSFDKIIIELPAASKILPGNNLYFLIKLKESLRLFTSFGKDKINLKLNLLGKRLVEAVRLKEKGLVFSGVLDSYKKLLSEVMLSDNLKDQLDFIGGREFVRQIFDRHISVLNALLDNASSSEKEVIIRTENELFAYLRDSELIPEYEIKADKNTPDLEYTIYHLQVPYKGEYELLMAEQGVRDVYQDKLEKLEFKIDGENKQLQGQFNNGFISYGKVKLDSGRREFILPATPSLNLFTGGKEVSSGSEIPLRPLTSDTWYTIKFEARIRSGDKFRVQLVSDENSTVDFDKVYTKDNPDKDWNEYRIGIFFNKPASTYAAVRFSGFSASFRNIRIERLLNNPVFLRSSDNIQIGQDSTSSVEFNQYSPVLYSGKIKLKSGGFIIFSESFHKDWQLKLFNDKESFVPKQRFLANMYANAWYVPQEGEYNFELEFIPQRTFYKGLVISAAAFVSMLIFYLISIKHEKKNN